jgi:hypothetical protein
VCDEKREPWSEATEGKASFWKIKNPILNKTGVRLHALNSVRSAAVHQVPSSRIV